MRTIQSNKNIIPGIHRIWLLPVNDIRTYVVNPQTGFAGINLFLGKLPTLLQTALDSITATISTVSNDSGTYYRCNIRCFIPGISEENQNAMMEFAKEKFVVMLKSYDNVQRSIGTPNIPLDFTFRESYSPRLGYEVTLSGNVPSSLIQTVMQYEIGGDPVIPPDNPDPVEGVSVTVYVTDENQIDFIEDAVVILSNGSTSVSGTNAQGTTTFFNVPDGTYTLQVSKTGYQETGAGIVVSGQDVYISFSLLPV